MKNANKTKNPEINRRDALKRLGLAFGAVYVTPTLLTLSNAHAASGSGSGGGGSGGGGSGGGGSSASAASAVSVASAPSSSGDDDKFSGDPTPDGRDLSAEDEMLLIRNGWQKARRK